MPISWNDAATEPSIHAKLDELALLVQTVALSRPFESTLAARLAGEGASLEACQPALAASALASYAKGGEAHAEIVLAVCEGIQSPGIKVGAVGAATRSHQFYSSGLGGLSKRAAP